MMTLNDALAGMGACQVQTDEAVLGQDFVGISIDSRTVTPGQIFFAVRGKNLDGHDYVPQALAAGAALAVVCEAYEDAVETRLVRVADPLRALHGLAHSLRQMHNPLTVAITGSVGKTTTKNFVGEVFSALAPTVYSRKSFNNEFGVPLSLCGIEAATRYACIEIGINTPGEMSALAQMVAPDIGIITNIGMAHIEHFGSKDGILEEKAKFLDGIRPGGTAVLNADDEKLASRRAWLQVQGLKTLWFGTSPEADIRAVSRQSVGDGQDIEIATSPDAATIHVHITPGDQGTMYAALACVAAGVAAGIAPDRIAQILGQVTVESRMRIRAFAGGQIVDDSYNASQASMLNGIEWVSGMTGAAVLVLGDIGEVGTFMTESYRQVLAAAAAKGVRQVITVGSTGANWQEAAAQSGFDPEHLRVTTNWSEALAELKKSNASGPVNIFVKGSRFSHLERVALALEDQISTCLKVRCTKYIHCSACPEFNGSV
ncbi:MAG: UDP-N-acetylmuramoyl-tripeptide--D-alanyl-D-alanine ligase [Alphaproteobacteria bacterium]|nr:MAG: UDP-N-acetylmuramoyl-tripeptide--D-alanyl-D-alanine ligase [Alphaproteobacteria bacterium]